MAHFWETIAKEEIELEGLTKTERNKNYYGKKNLGYIAEDNDPDIIYRDEIDKEYMDGLMLFNKKMMEWMYVKDSRKKDKK